MPALREIASRRVSKPPYLIRRDVEREVKDNEAWIDETLERGRGMGIPNCCVFHFIAHALMGPEFAAAESYGFLVAADPDVEPSGYVPCPVHRENPPPGYRWAALPGSPAEHMKGAK